MLPIFPSSNTDFIGSAHDAGGPYLPLAGGTMLGIIYGKGGTSSRLDLTELSGSKLQYGTLSLEVATNLSLNVSGVPKFAVDTSGNIQLTTTSKVLFSPIAANGDYIGSDGTNIDIIQSNNILARFPRSSAAQLSKGLDVFDFSGAANQSILIRQNNGGTLTGLTPFVVDGASAVAYTLDTKNTLANATAKLFALRNNTSEKVTVLASGFVGIGITSPTATLHINTGSAANDATGIKLKINSAWTDWSMEVTGAGAIFQSSGGSVKNLLNPGGNSYITAGNVGIGTTIAATSTLQVVGDSNLGGFVVSNAGLLTAGTVPVARITGLGTMATAATTDYLPLTQSAIPTSFVDLFGSTRGVIKKLDYTIIGPVTNTSNVGIAELFTVAATLGSGGGANYYAKMTQVLVPLTNVETMNAVYGEIAYTYHYGTGVVSNLVGKYVICGQVANAGAVTTLTGFHVNAFSQSTGVVASQSSLLISCNRTGAGTTTDRRAININALNNSGTITDTYGIYIGLQTSGTQTNLPFSIYSVDANAKMYHAGYVGIGTTSPGGMLQVTSIAAGTVGQIIQGAISQTANLLTVKNSYGTVIGAIGSAGEMGVGTDRAASLGLFVTAGTYYGQHISPTIISNYGGGLASMPTFSGSLTVAYGVSTSAYITGGSTVTTAYNLAVKGFVPFDSDDYDLRIEHGLWIGNMSAAVENTYGITSVVSAGNGKYNLNISGTAPNYIAGNVGIGTISPVARLQVISNAAGTIGEIIRGYAGQTANLIEWQNSNATVLACVTAAGKVGIGTTYNPGRKLTVFDELDITNGQIRFGYNDLYYWEVGRESTATGRLMIVNKSNNTPTELLSILTSGYVGIGITSPTSKLHVVGDSNLGGFIVSSAGVVTAGTVPAARLSGIVPTANLGTGTANATTYLRGDQTWQPVSGGNNLDAIYNAMMN